MSDNPIKPVLRKIFLPVLMVIIIWGIKLAETLFHYDLSFLGIYPLKVKGLIGLITAPLIHADFSHLSANTIPLLVMGSALFYFYDEIAYTIFFLIYFTTNLCIWLFAREAYHIGASGLIYGLAFFLFFSGMFRKNTRLAALSLLVIFLYGSLVWGIIPNFFPDKNISWESHLMGAVSGIVFAVYYRNKGPEKDEYKWEEEEEDTVDDDADYKISENVEEPPDRKLWN